MLEHQEYLIALLQEELRSAIENREDPSIVKDLADALHSAVQTLKALLGDHWSRSPSPQQPQQVGRPQRQPRQRAQAQRQPEKPVSSYNWGQPIAYKQDGEIVTSARLSDQTGALPNLPEQDAWE